MKKVLLLAIGCCSLLAHAEMYKVNVKRIDQDLYKTQEGVYIQTRYCYEYTYGDDAIYNTSTQKLIFNSGTTCDVAKVFK